MFFTLKRSNSSNLRKFFSVGNPMLADLQFAVTVKAHSIARSHMRGEGKRRALFIEFHLLFVLLLKDVNI